MKYYIIEISEGDSKIAGKAMYEYETSRNKAEAMFHKKIGTAMDSELYTEHRIALMNSTMAVEMSHVFVRPQTVEPEVPAKEEAPAEE